MLILNGFYYTYFDGFFEDITPISTASPEALKQAVAPNLASICLDECPLCKIWSD